MNDWERLNNERIDLERELATAEQALEQQRRSARPDQALMVRLGEQIANCLERLKPVNEQLACTRRLS